MDRKQRLSNGLAEYRRKIEAGEIEPAKTMTPIEKAKANPKSLRATLNAKCWECAAFQRSEVTACHIMDCPLWKLRPWQKNSETEEAEGGEDE